MKFELMELPFDHDALEPFLSARTLQTHHGKHHAGYVDKLDKALGDDPLREQTLEEILLESSGKLFDLAAQVWNHDCYWHSLSLTRCEPDTEGHLAQLIQRSFGGMAQFNERFAEAAQDEFGSGWAWLAYHPENDKLEVFSTTDALNPLTSGRQPLLTLDVWEHAYYLDYQNERGRYIEEFLSEHINWAFAEKNLDTARK